MIKWLLFFFAAVAYKAISNFINLSKIVRYIDMYGAWLEASEKPMLDEHIPSIKKLIKDAGITDIYVPVIENMGYGYATSSKTNVFNYFPSDKLRYATVMFSSMEQARGVYKSRVKDAVNLFYWVNVIAFLPQTIFKFIGANGERTFAKLLQVFYWMACAVYAIWGKEILQFIREIAAKAAS